MGRARRPAGDHTSHTRHTWSDQGTRPDQAAADDPTHAHTRRLAKGRGSRRPRRARERPGARGPVHQKSHSWRAGLATGRVATGHGPLVLGCHEVAAPSARLPPFMAVPKRKTSKARRDARRAQHKIEAPRVSTCAHCGSPKRSHRICPTCGTYKGREIEPLRLQAP